MVVMEVFYVVIYIVKCKGFDHLYYPISDGTIILTILLVL